ESAKAPDARPRVGLRAYVLVPLLRARAPRAGFVVGETAPREWTPGEVALVEDAAKRTWAILERARAEGIVRESEERFRSLASIITDVMWTADAAGRFAAPQRAWAAYTGQSPEEYAGDGWLDALHPDDRARIRAAWSEAVAAGRLFQSTGRLRHAPSGEY